MKAFSPGNGGMGGLEGMMYDYARVASERRKGGKEMAGEGTARGSRGHEVGRWAGYQRSGTSSG